MPSLERAAFNFGPMSENHGRGYVMKVDTEGQMFEKWKYARRVTAAPDSLLSKVQMFKIRDFEDVLADQVNYRHCLWK